MSKYQAVLLQINCSGSTSSFNSIIEEVCGKTGMQVSVFWTSTAPLTTQTLELSAPGRWDSIQQVLIYSLLLLLQLF